jgi:hypothetical protein
MNTKLAEQMLEVIRREERQRVVNILRCVAHVKHQSSDFSDKEDGAKFYTVVHWLEQYLELQPR